MPLLRLRGRTAAAPPRPASARLSPYARLFSAPGSRAFTAGSLLARLPMGMFTVSAVIMIVDAHGSYALAGAVTATGLAATAVAGPLTARLIDRHGQARIALPATLAAVCGSLSLTACVRYGAPEWTLFASYAATAATPNTGGMSRARWAHLFRTDPAARHTANSLEQALDELCFMSGPLLAAVLCTAVLPESGTLTGAALLLVGMLVFTGQRRTEPPSAGPVSGRPAPPLRMRALLPLLVTFLCTGAVFGSVEVATIAFADGRGQQAAAGAVLACQAAGSAAAGLALGTLRLPGSRLRRRFTLCVCVMAGLALLPPAAAATGSLAVLAVALLAAGMGTAPTMVTGMTLVQETVPASRLNEGMTWAVTALLGGIAAGSAAGGWAAEQLPVPAAFAVAACAAFLAATVAAMGAALARTRDAAIRTPGRGRQPRARRRSTRGTLRPYRPSSGSGGT